MVTTSQRYFFCWKKLRTHKEDAEVSAKKSSCSDSKLLIIEKNSMTLFIIVSLVVDGTVALLSLLPIARLQLFREF
jgi:hypothetical protein